MGPCGQALLCVAGFKLQVAICNCNLQPATIPNCLFISNRIIVNMLAIVVFVSVYSYLMSVVS